MGDNLTELREYFEDESVKYDKISRSLSKPNGDTKGLINSILLADKYHDVAKAIVELQRELGEIE